VSQPSPRIGPAYLLSQIGHDAAYRFAELLRPLDLTVHHVGILRLIVTLKAPMTQAELCERLGVLPSRLVTWLDALSARGLVERRPKPTDRRSNHLYATEAGERLFAEAEALSRALDDELLHGLSGPDRVELERLLRELARVRGLLPGHHPAYRHEER